MGVVSSLFGLFLPRRRTPMYYAPTRRTQMYSPQNRFAQSRLRASQSFRPMSIQIRSNPNPIPARRSFNQNPLFQPQRKLGMFDGMFSTSFHIQRNQNMKKKENFAQKLLASKRRSLLFR